MVVTEFASETVASKLTSSEEEQSRVGSHVAWVAVWEAGVILRLCPPDPWDLVALAVAQAASAVAVSEEVLEGVSVVDSAAEDLEIAVAAVSVADSEIVAADSAIAAEDSATAVVGLVIVVIAVIAAATGLSAARTASLPRMHQTALAAVAMEVAMAASAAATTGGAAPDLVVGMAVKAAVAHMTIDPAAEASVVATVVAVVTATLDSPAATWSPSGLVEKMVGIATMVAATVEAETTTGLETATTLGSAASTVATKTPGSCDATNKTNLLDVLWWVSKLLSSYLSAPFLRFRQEGKLDRTSPGAQTFGQEEPRGKAILYQNDRSANVTFLVLHRRPRVKNRQVSFMPQKPHRRPQSVLHLVCLETIQKSPHRRRKPRLGRKVIIFPLTVFYFAPCGYIGNGNPKRGCWYDSGNSSTSDDSRRPNQET